MIAAWLFPFRPFRESPLAGFFLKPGEVVPPVTLSLSPPRQPSDLPPVTTAPTQATATEALTAELLRPTKIESAQPRRQKEASQGDKFASRYLSAAAGSGNSAAWTVATTSDQDDSDDVASAIGSALVSGGKELVFPFRNIDAQHSIAADLFRGDRSILSRLHLSRFCSHIVVGRLTTTPFGSIDGLFIVRATLSLRVLTCEGEFVRQFDITEKGGGLNSDAGRQRAIDELKATLPNRVASEIN